MFIFKIKDLFVTRVFWVNVWLYAAGLPLYLQISNVFVLWLQLTLQTANYMPGVAKTKIF